jgi:preprotein translocase subunit SecB
MELEYGGLFTVENVPEEQLAAVPADRGAADDVPLRAPDRRRCHKRDGGFPPLLLDSIDFVQLYRQQAGRSGRKQQAEAARKRRVRAGTA